ncbi:MAG: hypothetical protein KAT20_05765, partial [Desulfuromonadales bacterium]|nr:hypothetical protein [Desulfuromonadales bacterium]
NDRIFVQSTGTDHLTEIYAGEGSDTFFIGGDTPPVVSQDLLGHSGIITHEASSADERFNGVGVDGISANVGDNDEPFVRIIKDDGLLQITEDGLLAAQYSLVLSRPPGGKVGITAITPRPSPNDEKNGAEYINVNGGQAYEFIFDDTNWYIPQTVTVTAVQDLAYEGAHIATINHVVTEFPILDDPNYEKMAIPSVSVEIVDDDLPGLVIEQTDGTSRVIEGADFSSAAPFADTYTIRLNQQPEADVTVELINEDGQLALEQTVFTFTQDNWAIAQTVRLIAADDGINEGFHHGYIKHLVSSNQDDQTLPATDTFAATIEAEARSSVLLSYAPIDKSAISSVQLGDDLLDADRYRLDQKMLTILDKDGQPEMVTAQIIVSYEYIKPGFQNVDVQLVGVEIGDNDAPGVLVLQSGGSTNVIEVEDAVPGNSTSPYVDQYQVVLTARPDAQVRVDISPQPTKTSARPPFKFSAAADNVAVTELGFSESSDPTISLTSGGPAPDDGQLSGDLRFNIDLTPDDDSDALITVVLAQADMSGYQSIDDLIDGINAALKDAGLEEKIFSIRDENRVVIAKVAEPQHEQVAVSTTTLTFTPDNWNVVQNVTVSAINDDVVDGGDSKSFAPIEQTVSRIQGPLIINGAGGDGSDAGLGADPFRLPGETNDVGNVLEVPTDSDGNLITTQVVLDGNDIGKLGPTYFKSLDTFESGDENNDQKAKIYIIITSGPGSGQERVIVARNGNTFILAEDWDLDDLPTDESRYIFKRQLGKVNEAEQVDVAMVYNNESLADNVGTLTATHLYGLGMGPDLEIGGLDWKGGMTYTNLENLTINLGAGNDQLEITGIQNRDDFQTVTVVNTGAGDDVVHFNGPQAGESGLFALHLEQGDDRVTAENTTAPLIIFGDDGVDTIQSGDGDDIIFADFGRVDYLDTSGELITRFGMGQRGEVKDAVIPAADLESVPFAQTDGNYYGPSLAVSRQIETGWDDPIRGGGGADLLIGGFGNDEMHGDAGDDILIGDNGIADFLNGQLSKIASGDPNLGGEDEIYGGAGNDLLIGGAVADQLYGDSGNDYMVGDAGRATYLSGRLRTVETIDEHRFIGGNDWLDGGAGFDAMFGGHGDDTFVGDFTEDLMIGEYARLTMDGDTAETVVRLGQGNLDLIANRQFGLYNPLALTPSLSQLGSVLLPTQIREFIAAQR